MLFVHIAEGVDDETWLFHLRRHDYSSWFREQVKDRDLAEEARNVEDSADVDAVESRRRILGLVSERYTGPATGVVHAAR
jgi:hypothetical protein